jgi:hypothetical protein
MLPGIDVVRSEAGWSSGDENICPHGYHHFDA